MYKYIINQFGMLLCPSLTICGELHIDIFALLKKAPGVADTDVISHAHRRRICLNSDKNLAFKKMYLHEF